MSYCASRCVRGWHQTASNWRHPAMNQAPPRLQRDGPWAPRWRRGSRPLQLSPCIPSGTRSSPAGHSRADLVKLGILLYHDLRESTIYPDFDIFLISEGLHSGFPLGSFGIPGLSASFLICHHGFDMVLAARKNHLLQPKQLWIPQQARLHRVELSQDINNINTTETQYVKAKYVPFLRSTHKYILKWTTLL